MKTSPHVDTGIALSVVYLDCPGIGFGDQHDAACIKKRFQVGMGTHATAGTGTGDNDFGRRIGKGPDIVHSQNVTALPPPVVLHTPVGENNQVGMKGSAINGHGSKNS